MNKSNNKIVRRLIETKLVKMSDMITNNNKNKKRKRNKNNINNQNKNTTGKSVLIRNNVTGNHNIIINGETVNFTMTINNKVIDDGKNPVSDACKPIYINKNFFGTNFRDLPIDFLSPITDFESSVKQCFQYSPKYPTHNIFEATFVAKTIKLEKGSKIHLNLLKPAAALLLESPTGLTGKTIFKITIGKLSGETKMNEFPDNNKFETIITDTGMIPKGTEVLFDITIQVFIKKI